MGEIERLHDVLIARDIIEHELRTKIERLQAALKIAYVQIRQLEDDHHKWKHRYEAEQQAHEATIKHCDRVLDELKWRD